MKESVDGCLWLIRAMWSHAVLTLVLLAFGLCSLRAEDDTTLRVFIFAGQSNMIGSDSKVSDFHRYPPFVGRESPQAGVRFSYCLGGGWNPDKPSDVKLYPLALEWIRDALNGQERQGVASRLEGFM